MIQLCGQGSVKMARLCLTENQLSSSKPCRQKEQKACLLSYVVPGLEEARIWGGNTGGSRHLVVSPCDLPSVTALG